MWGAVRPGACLRGEVALAGELQTSAVGGPVERVAAVAETLEAARGIDAGVVTGPLEGALVDVCGATGRKVRAQFQGVAGGTALSLRGTSVHSGPRAPGSAQSRLVANLRPLVPARFSILSPRTAWYWDRSHLTLFSGGGQGRNILSRRDCFESLPVH